MKPFTESIVRTRIVLGLVAVIASLSMVSSGCVTQPVPPTSTILRCDVGLVGDSMLRYPTDHVDLIGTFAAGNCAATVDAEVARPAAAAANIVEGWAAAGTLPTIVGITCGGWDAYIGSDNVGESVDRVMAAVGSRQVVWVNSFVLISDGRDQAVNAVLAAKDAEYPNLTVVDHYSWVDANRGYLIDWAHLNAEGERIWTQRLLDAVRSVATI